MAPPIVYRWDDAQAPVARGERRSAHDICYACLVTGYGAKPGAGWTRPYVNATFDKAAFRNNPVTGKGMYVQIDGFGGTNAHTPYIKAFETMTDESTGLGPFCNTTYGNSFTTSNGENTTARPWVLIADDRAFYLFIWVSDSSGSAPSGAAQCSVMFFGDCVPRKSDDNYFVALSSGYYGCAIGSVWGSTSINWAANLGYSTIYCPRPSSGVATPSYPYHIRGGGPSVDSGGVGVAGIPYTAGDQILIARPFINDGAAYTMRGYFPGHYYPCHNAAFSNLQTVSQDGKTFINIRASSGGGTPANSFISLDDWRT